MERLPNNLFVKELLTHLVIYYIYSTNILITEASSTCLEAIACGISVIMMENEEGLTFDSIPRRVSEKLYRKVRTQDHLIQALKYFDNTIDESLA